MRASMNVNTAIGNIDHWDDASTKPANEYLKYYRDNMEHESNIKSTSASKDIEIYQFKNAANAATAANKNKEVDSLLTRSKHRRSLLQKSFDEVNAFQREIQSEMKLTREGIYALSPKRSGGMVSEISGDVAGVGTGDGDGVGVGVGLGVGSELESRSGSGTGSGSFFGGSNSEWETFMKKKMETKLNKTLDELEDSVMERKFHRLEQTWKEAANATTATNRNKPEVEGREDAETTNASAASSVSRESRASNASRASLEPMSNSTVGTRSRSSRAGTPKETQTTNYVNDFKPNTSKDTLQRNRHQHIEEQDLHKEGDEYNQITNLLATHSQTALQIRREMRQMLTQQTKKDMQDMVLSSKELKKRVQHLNPVWVGERSHARNGSDVSDGRGRDFSFSGNSRESDNGKTAGVSKGRKIEKVVIDDAPSSTNEYVAKNKSYTSKDAMKEEGGNDDASDNDEDSYMGIELRLTQTQSLDDDGPISSKFDSSNCNNGIFGIASTLNVPNTPMGSMSVDRNNFMPNQTTLGRDTFRDTAAAPSNESGGHGASASAASLSESTSRTSKLDYDLDSIVQQFRATRMKYLALKQQGEVEMRDVNKADDVDKIADVIDLDIVKVIKPHSSNFGDASTLGSYSVGGRSMRPTAVGATGTIGAIGGMEREPTPLSSSSSYAALFRSGGYADKYQNRDPLSYGKLKENCFDDCSGQRYSLSATGATTSNNAVKNDIDDNYGRCKIMDMCNDNGFIDDKINTASNVNGSHDSNYASNASSTNNTHASSTISTTNKTNNRANVAKSPTSPSRKKLAYSGINEDNLPSYSLHGKYSSAKSVNSHRSTPSVSSDASGISVPSSPREMRMQRVRDSKQHQKEYKKELNLELQKDEFQVEQRVKQGDVLHEGQHEGRCEDRLEGEGRQQQQKKSSKNGSDEELNSGSDNKNHGKEVLEYSGSRVENWWNLERHRKHFEELNGVETIDVVAPSAPIRHRAFPFKEDADPDAPLTIASPAKGGFGSWLSCTSGHGRVHSSHAPHTPNSPQSQHSINSSTRVSRANTTLPRSELPPPSPRSKISRSKSPSSVSSKSSALSRSGQPSGPPQLSRSSFHKAVMTVSTSSATSAMSAMNASIEMPSLQPASTPEHSGEDGRKMNKFDSVGDAKGTILPIDEQHCPQQLQQQQQEKEEAKEEEEQQGKKTLKKMPQNDRPSTAHSTPITVSNTVRRSLPPCPEGNASIGSKPMPVPTSLVLPTLLTPSEDSSSNDGKAPQCEHSTPSESTQEAKAEIVTMGKKGNLLSSSALPSVINHRQETSGGVSALTAASAASAGTAASAEPVSSAAPEHLVDSAPSSLPAMEAALTTTSARKITSSSQLQNEDETNSLASTVASTALTVIHHRLDEAKFNFRVALSENDFEKQRELASLISRLEEAAVVMKKLDGS